MNLAAVASLAKSTQVTRQAERGMKLAVIGASGRTGVAVVRAALERGIEVFPVLHDDSELEPIAGLVPAGQERFADYTSTEALVAAMHGCTHAVAAIQPRELGPGFPLYDGEATTAIINAAVEVGLTKVLWVSTQGAYHWSKHVPSKQGYECEINVRRVEGPWGIAKLSCYHDEIFDTYVAPPDGGRPRPVPRNGQWSPISREDAGRLLMACLELVPYGRAPCFGGPEDLLASDLARIVEPRVKRGRGRLTACLGVPDGDHAVLLEDTLTTTGTIPTQRLEPWLDATLAGRSLPDPPRSVYPRGGPLPSILDVGADLPLWETTGTVLRRVAHELLGDDLRARGVEPAQLDFSAAQPRAPHVEVHGGRWSTLRGVRALDADGQELVKGEVNWLWDELAEEFRVFFGRRIPDAIWEDLDTGTRRRLAEDKRYKRDKRVVAFNS